MHADGKSTLASVSKWNSGKVNFVHSIEFLVKQEALWATYLTGIRHNSGNKDKFEKF